MVVVSFLFLSPLLSNFIKHSCAVRGSNCLLSISPYNSWLYKTVVSSIFLFQLKIWFFYDFWMAAVSYLSLSPFYLPFLCVLSLFSWWHQNCIINFCSAVTVTSVVLLKMFFLPFWLLQSTGCYSGGIGTHWVWGFLFDNNWTKSCHVRGIIRVVFSRMHCSAWDDFALQT